MSMKVYQVEGIRHQAVVFAASPEEAVAQAVEQGTVGDWEAPVAVEVPLPRGYRLVYDPAAAAVQAGLPLPAATPEATKPHKVTTSGVKVYDTWQDNIIMDADAPVLGWKAHRDIYGAHTSVPRQPYLASENSEDALSWNQFRTLERTGHLDVVARALGLDDEFQVLYWYHDWDAAEPVLEIKAALDRVEPWGTIGGRRQTETDIILKGTHFLVMVECKLGEPGTRVRAWERKGKKRIPTTYEEPLRALLANMENWELTMRRFYQLLRHLILANELCRLEGWPHEPHLLAIVNGLNLNRNGVPHAIEFDAFRGFLRLPPSQTHILTWQELLTRVEATFDPTVRPLLAHVRGLSHLHEAKQ